MQITITSVNTLILVAEPHHRSNQDFLHAPQELEEESFQLLHVLLQEQWSELMLSKTNTKTSNQVMVEDAPATQQNLNLNSSTASNKVPNTHTHRPAFHPMPKLAWTSTSRQMTMKDMRTSNTQIVICIFCRIHRWQPRGPLCL